VSTAAFTPRSRAQVSEGLRSRDRRSKALNVTRERGEACMDEWRAELARVERGEGSGGSSAGLCRGEPRALLQRLAKEVIIRSTYGSRARSVSFIIILLHKNILIIK